ncbi:MAG: LysR family transcriptional regulator [Gemmataceae bacterium]|nr:LysR family transcriptional regulator [Gemmataceae bacterium]
MGRQKTYRQSTLTAFDVVLQFAEWVRQRPRETIDAFLAARFPWLDYRGFRGYVGLIEEKYKLTVFAYAKQKSGRNGLTEEGRRFVRWAREWADAAGAGRAGYPVERRTVGSYVFSTAHILAPALAKYFGRREHDHLRLGFKDYDDPRRALDAVGDRRMACAFVAQSQKLRLSGHANEVDFRTVSPGIHPVLIFPRGEPVGPADLTTGKLAARRFVVPRYVLAEWARHLPPGEPTGVGERVVVHSYVEVLAFVRQGVGCGLMPGVRPGLLDAPGVAQDVGYLPLPGSTPVPLGLAYPKNYETTASDGFKEFVDVMTEELNRPGYFVTPDA